MIAKVPVARLRSLATVRLNHCRVDVQCLTSIAHRSPVAAASSRWTPSVSRSKVADDEVTHLAKKPLHALQLRDLVK